MADFLVPGYGDKNRAFVQAILGRNTFTWGSAQTLIAAISSVHSGQEVPIDSIDQEDLESYITLANRALSPLDLEIRSTLHQTTRNRVYALVNVASDPMTQLATTHSADEINFVKKMLDTMFKTNNRGRTEAMCISSIEVVQLSSKSTRRETQVQPEGQGAQPVQKKLTGNEVEDLVRNLELEGWLEKSDAGFYALSPRALMELKGWLVETYNDVDEEDMDEEEAASRRKIKSCHACKEIITTVSSIFVQTDPLTTAGPTLRTPGVSIQTPRYLHTELLPNTAIAGLSVVPDSVGR
jgi:non-structural maintenance of chromosomes element 1